MNKDRIDHNIILSMVGEGTRVLDVGCADGKLLHMLENKKNISGQGIEIEHDKVEICLQKGLSVVEGDANKEITYFPKDSFDYVVLSQTLQTVQKPKIVLGEILRVGKKAIISFPNFGHWMCRFQIGIFGKMPVTKDLKLPWFDTQNIHLCTIKDFEALTKSMMFKIEKGYGINRNKKIMKSFFSLYYMNIFASHAVFLISKKS